MRNVNGFALAVLVATVAALVGSVAWASSRGADEDGWMMSRYDSGMMGYASNGAGEPIGSIAEARDQAERFADRLDLEVGEVMRFQRNYYAELEEKGTLATEVLIDPSSGAVWLEYGPAMMWNTRFGMMSDYRLRDGSGMMGGMMGDASGMMDGAGGMMGGAGMMGGVGGMMGGNRSLAPSNTSGTVSGTDAVRIANEWLGRSGSRATAGEAERFPGYYTLHTLEQGKVTGMLSVNASTGAVWFHWWHGRFVSMEE